MFKRRGEFVFINAIEKWRFHIIKYSVSCYSVLIWKYDVLIFVHDSRKLGRTKRSGFVSPTERVHVTQLVNSNCCMATHPVLLSRNLIG